MMRKYPQQRHPSHKIKYRENTVYGRRLRRGSPHSELEPVSSDSDSFASTTTTPSEENVFDADVLEDIERGYYHHLQQQQHRQLLEAEEDNGVSHLDIPYLNSGSASRDSATNSELRQHSRRPASKSRHRTGGSAYRQRRRKTRVTEESPDDYIYHVSGENSHSLDPVAQDIHELSGENTSDSDAMNPDQHQQQNKTHRRKSTKGAATRHNAYWIRTPNTTKQRDVNRRREPRSSRRDSNSSSHSLDPQATRPVSVEEISIEPSSRPALHRSKTTSSRTRPAAKIEEDGKPGSDQSTAATPKDKKKTVGLFSNFFPGPLPPHLEKKVTCLTCFSDDIPISRSAKLACSHRMCHTCLKRVFTMSVKDPQHMPPRCCTTDHIPLKHVEKLFDMKFKVKWNKKYQEYTTKNRIYCTSKGCGEWIKPNHISIDTSSGASGGREYGKCSKCKTKVCCTCNGKWHAGKECPKDDETKKFVEVAQEQGWQRCYNCAAMVELKEGCNHMTCRCTAEFCMICGLQWKTCDCPMFNFDANEELEAMDIARARRTFAEGGGRQPLRYQEELDRRRQQEQEDEAMARHMEALDINDYTNPTAPAANTEVFEVGNTGGHFMNEHFTRPQIQIDNMRHADREALDTALVTSTQNHDRANTPSPPPRSHRTRLRRSHRDVPPAPSPPLPEQTRRTTSGFMRAFNNSPTTRHHERVSLRRRNSSPHHEEMHESLPEDLRTPSRPRKPRRHEHRATALAGLDPVNGRQPTGASRVDQWRRNCM